jgi:CO dehydrogenase nickel-insertion accessory protein CooC1
MATIHLIGGEKGGVGKSLVARVAAQYMIDRSIPFLGFDSDRSHGALMRFYRGYASPIVIDHTEDLDAVVEAAHEDPQRRILVDLAAQTTGLRSADCSMRNPIWGFHCATGT